MQKIGRRIYVITEDNRETTFLFHRLSVARQRENAVSFLGTFLYDYSDVAVIYTLSIVFSQICGFVLVGDIIVTTTTTTTTTTTIVIIIIIIMSQNYSHFQRGA